MKTSTIDKLLHSKRFHIAWKPSTDQTVYVIAKKIELQLFVSIQHPPTKLDCKPKRMSSVWSIFTFPLAMRHILWWIFSIIMGHIIQCLLFIMFNHCIAVFVCNHRIWIVGFNTLLNGSSSYSVLPKGLPLSTKRTPFREKESFSRKGLLLSRKGARGIGSGLIHGYYLLL